MTKDIHPDLASSRPCKISVVIATRERPRELEQCLQALQQQTCKDFELVIVDSAPPAGDLTNRNLAERFHARYLRVEEPGSSRARNYGALSCASEIIAFTDDDALPDPAWLAVIADTFQEKEIMAAMGRTMPVKIETEAERLQESMGGFVNGGDARLMLDANSSGWFELVNFKGLGMLANMAVRRSVFNKLPDLFDLNLGRGSTIHGYDENNSLFKIIRAGHKIIYEPRMRVAHPYLSTIEELRQEMLFNIKASAFYIMKLWTEEKAFRPQIRRHIARKLFGGSAATMPSQLKLARTDIRKARWEGIQAYRNLRKG